MWVCAQGYHSQAPLLPAPLTPRPRPPVHRDEGGLWGFHSLSEQLPSLGLSVRGAHLGPQLEGSVPHTGPIQGEHFPFPQHRTLHTDCFTPQTRSHGPIHISQGRKQAENSPLTWPKPYGQWVLEAGYIPGSITSGLLGMAPVKLHATGRNAHGAGVLQSKTFVFLSIFRRKICIVLASYIIHGLALFSLSWMV